MVTRGGQSIKTKIDRSQFRLFPPAVSGFARTLVRPLFEDEDVLPRQEVLRLDPPEPLPLELGDGLAGEHAVERLDGNAGILAAVLDQDDSAVLLQGLPDRGSFSFSPSSGGSPGQQR